MIWTDEFSKERGLRIKADATVAQLQVENKRLRAHIQDAADRARDVLRAIADDDSGCLKNTTNEEFSEVWELLRNFHLAALAPQEKDHE